MERRAEQRGPSAGRHPLRVTGVFPSRRADVSKIAILLVLRNIGSSINPEFDTRDVRNPVAQILIQWTLGSQFSMASRST